MPRQHDFYLDDTLAAIEKIQSYTTNVEKNVFANDQLRVDAILLNLIVIGEASKQVSDEVRAQIPEVEWRKIAGFRDVAVHQYFRVNLDIVWDIIENHLPPLHTKIQQYLAERKE